MSHLSYIIKVLKHSELDGKNIYFVKTLFYSINGFFHKRFDRFIVKTFPIHFCVCFVNVIEFYLSLTVER